MKHLARCVTLILAGLLLGLGPGCSKKEKAIDTDPEITAVIAKLPAAAAVKTAVEKKDYDAAMAALLQIKSAVTTEDQKVQFTGLAHWLKMKLMDVGPADAKAAEALNALRSMSATR